MPGGGAGQVATAAASRNRQRKEAYDAAISALGTTSGAKKIASYFATVGKYPANNQVPAVGKDSSGNFDATTLNQIEFGNTPAPKGHFIMKAFDRDYATVSGISSTALSDLREQDETRPSTVCSAFGRIWYSGTADQATQGKVFFSQVAGDIVGFERCHQQNDPTSEDNPDVLDTDGGVIVIHNSGTIVSLVEAFSGVLALCANGVWLISGTEQIGFTATGYQVQKITDIGCISRDSVVFADGVVLYWSDAGVYAIAPGQQGIPVATSLSQSSIQSFYNAIPDALKRYAEGTYASREKIVYWMYGDDVEKPFRKRNFLAYNTELGAFIPYAQVQQQSLDAIYGTTSYPASFISRGYFVDSIFRDDVVDSSGVVVTESGGASVYTEFTLAAEDQPSLKILTTVPTDLGQVLQFSEFNNTTYKDYGTESYLSYVETGSITGGDLMRNKQAQYIVNHFRRTEDGYELDENGNVALANQSGCFIRSKWDWTSTSNAGKWSNSQQAYRLKHLYIPLSVNDPFDYAYDVVSTKLLLRGNGYAFRLRYESDADKAFKLLGFGMPVTAEATV